MAVAAASRPSLSLALSLAWAYACSATRLWPLTGDLGVLGNFEGLSRMPPAKGLSGSFDCEVAMRLGYMINSKHLKRIYSPIKE